MKKLKVLLLLQVIVGTKFFIAQTPINLNDLDQTIVDPSLNLAVPNFHRGINDYCYDNVNNKLYVVGGFVNLGNGVTPVRSFTNIARFDLNTGLPDSNWTPVINNGQIRCILKDGNRIYLGGSFTMVNGQLTKHLVAVDANTGLTLQNYNFPLLDTINTIALNDLKDVLGVGFYNAKKLATANVPIFGIINNVNNGAASYNLIKSNWLSDCKTERIYYYSNNFYYLFNEYDGPSGNLNGGPTFSTIFQYNLTTTNNIDLLRSNNNPGNPTTGDRHNALDFIGKGDSLFIFCTDSLFPLEKFNNSPGIVYPLPPGIINRQTIGLKLTATPQFFNYPLNPPLLNAVNITNSYDKIYYLYTGSCTPPKYYVQFSVPVFIASDNDQFMFTSPSARPSTSCFHYYSSTYQYDLLGNLIAETPTVYGDKMGATGDRFFSIKTDDFNYFGMDFTGPTIFHRRASQIGPGDRIMTYCLRAGKLGTVKEINNLTAYCKGQTYKFAVPPFNKRVSTYNWSYTGSGVTFTNVTNDTITAIISNTAVPGLLKVFGITNCGQNSDTINMPLTFLTQPDIAVNASVALNCYNNQQANIIASSTTVPSSLKWVSPSTFTTLGATLNVLSQGSYSAYVTNNITGCTNYSITQIYFDTIKPVIANVLPSYTVFCTPPTITVAATSCTLPCNDSLYWQTGATTFTNNPLTYLPPNATNVVYAKNKNLVNGCIVTQSVTIIKAGALPTYTIISSVTTPTAGLPEFNSINCINDSILLTANAEPSAKVWWSFSGDSVTNPRFAKQAGAYTLKIKDTVTGCNSSFTALMPQDKILPQLILQNNLAYLNCSYGTATLQASTLSPNTTIVWVAPSISFTNTSPVSTSTPALYYAIATNTNNGCVKKDSLNLQLENTLTLNTSNDSTICNTSAISLSATPIGGTFPFVYAWSNGGGSNTTATFNNNTSTIKYIISITDAASCVGTDTIKVTVPALLTDSSATFKNCDPLNPSGQIQIFGKGGTPPYLYSIDNGVNYQSINSFTNLAFGNYQFLVKDSIGCTRFANVLLNNSSQNPKVDFLVNTTLMQTDTFVIVDISNPRPDSVQWILPPNVQIVNNVNPFSPVVVCVDTGDFFVKAYAYFGGCKDSLNKLVKFIKYDTTFSNTTINRGIKTFSVYPNPNTGQFNVVLEFYKKQSYVLKIVTNTGAEVLQPATGYGTGATIPVTIPAAAPGAYVLKVIAEFDAKQKIFIITN
jgi:hypothetical protein